MKEGNNLESSQDAHVQGNTGESNNSTNNTTITEDTTLSGQLR